MRAEGLEMVTLLMAADNSYNPEGERASVYANEYAPISRVALRMISLDSILILHRQSGITIYCVQHNKPNII